MNSLTEEQREKALIEVSLLSSLKHPNIVSHQESFQENGFLYIVMEYVDGGDLSQKIIQRKSHFFSEDEVLKVLIQICLALQYIHEKKIVHRDIKPQNVFLTRLGVAKIGDFGVARALDGSQDLCKTVIGTPFYLSPEVWSNAPYNAQTDIWSLGCIIYEMCMLKKPFTGQTAQQLYASVIRGNYERVSSRYSHGLRQLIGSMLNPSPSSRPTASLVLQLPLVKERTKTMIQENENQLKQVHIALPSNISSKKTNGLMTRKNSLGQKQFETKKTTKIVPNNPSDLPLPNEEPPKWALKMGGMVKIGSVKEEEFDQGELSEWDDLKGVTNYLHSSLDRATRSEEIPVWAKLPIHGIPEDPNQIKKQAEELKNRLESRLKPMLFTMLKDNIINEDSPSCGEFVLIFEQTDAESVEEMRKLIELESMIH